MQENRTAERKFLRPSANENHANQAQQNSQTSADNEVNAITQNIHRVSNILSSSPSQLTEQAKSYALGKVNSTITSETKKWLSRFGTANINLSLDKKGKLDNSSLDFLLPLYDNKTDWLVFSQLGYRHHDSRNTVNLGFGGRYFTPSWMYGLNTFFDNDFTGKNKRMGFGGEIWTDYVKFSANTYWHLSKWRQSPKELDYEERPANGFDITGIFFLPVYPNLGGKLSYEQYFGDNVALFNRETKQKNPTLARFGLNYTPFPLMTMGVDYKLGGSRHSETLFLANLNYRFGMPFENQISPSSVADIRTLSGSRYDLVERNNNIVLDYKKKPEFNLVMPSMFNGYSSQHVQIIPNITAEQSLKKISWQMNDEFRKNGGVIIPRGTSVELDLPKYSVQGVNSYILSAIADIDSSNKPKTTQMNVVVEPFAIKEQIIKPNSQGPVISNGKSSYDLITTITYGNKNNPPIKNKAIPNVKWSIEPPDEHTTLHWDKAGMTNDNGQLTATLSSTQSLKPDTKIYLAMDDQPKLEVKIDKPLIFTPLSDAIQAKDFVFDSKAPYEATEHKPLIVTATVFDTDGNPIKKKMDMNLQWSTEPSNMPGLLVRPEKGYENGTDQDGKIKAIVTSTQAITGVKVGVLINGMYQNFSEPFDFIAPKNIKIKLGDISVTPSSQGVKADGKAYHTFKVPVLDEHGNILRNQSIAHKFKTGLALQGSDKPVPKGVKLEIPENPITDAEGNLSLNMTSSVGVSNVYFTISPDLPDTDTTASKASGDVNFEPVPELVGIIVRGLLSINKKYIPPQETLYNVHDDITVLLSRDGENGLMQEAITPKYLNGVSTNSNLVTVSNSNYGDNDYGDITFVPENFTTEQRPVTVTVTIIDEKTQITHRYYHTFNPQRFIKILDTPVSLSNLEDSCNKQPNGDDRDWSQDRLNAIPSNATALDIGIAPYTNQVSLSNEYDKTSFPNFGLKKLIGKTDKLKVYNPQENKVYAYDFASRTATLVDPNSTEQGIAICVLRNSN
ncbi:inverse autotransporter beta domain-containing protein [Xenorhabdus ishibashii]|uniref:inverse autotransporter beta domain-containing protein n=1 Tax=Xenorhabdus ishibashii TaxID=1034471 RepID=UPI00142D32C3|nr:inverse autotransporter beta domain-containing protein [Xenorhabdus ishibashii]